MISHLKSYPIKQLINKRHTYHNTIQFKRVQFDICWLPNLPFHISIIHYSAPIFPCLLLFCVLGHHHLSDTSLPVTVLQTTHLPMLCFTLLRWMVTHPKRSELLGMLYFSNNKIIVKLAFICVNKLWANVYDFSETNYLHNIQAYCFVLAALSNDWLTADISGLPYTRNKTRNCIYNCSHQ